MEVNGSDSGFQVIHGWSGPRSLSTSLMLQALVWLYRVEVTLVQVVAEVEPEEVEVGLPLEQRDDTEVVDEPLYAHLLTVTATEVPYREEFLAKAETDDKEVARKIIYGPCNKKYRYCKQIINQRTPCLSKEIISRDINFILIRNPIDILPSFDDVMPVTIDELDLPGLVALYNELKQLGSAPPVIDALDLQRNPGGILKALCKALGIHFQASMLKWSAGPRPEDGIWAPWWYKSVHKSSGFNAPPLYPRKVFPLQLYELLEECRPFYNLLRSHALKPDQDTMKFFSPAIASLPVSQNSKILVWVDDEIVPRNDAKVSVFDSIFRGGDAVWEELHIYNGKVFKLDEHMDRLFSSAIALAFINMPTCEEVKHAIFATLIINGMHDGAHIHLTLTRGKKVTSGMSSAFNVSRCTLIVLAEWKPPAYNNIEGACLVTTSTRPNSPNIDGKANDPIMLDCDGFVSETNVANLVMEVVQNQGFVVQEKQLTITEFYTADEIWTIGAMGELTPVVEIDGRIIGNGEAGPITKQIQAAYKRLTEMEGEPIPFAKTT